MENRADYRVGGPTDGCVDGQRLEGVTRDGLYCRQNDYCIMHTSLYTSKLMNHVAGPLVLELTREEDVEYLNRRHPLRQDNVGLHRKDLLVALPPFIVDLLGAFALLKVCCT